MTWIGAFVPDCVLTSWGTGVEGSVVTVVADVDVVVVVLVVVVVVVVVVVIGRQSTTSFVSESDQPSIQEHESILVVVQLRMLPDSEL